MCRFLRQKPGLCSWTFRVSRRVDDVNQIARVKAQGSDAKGRGAANATAMFRIEPAAAGSKVLIHTDLTLSGAVAQYGRGVGMIQATAAQLVGQFADNLRARLAQGESVASPNAPSAPLSAKPISGFALMAKVIWDAIRSWFRRMG